MAITYNLLSTTTLSSNQSSIVLSSIPQTHTDLLVLASIRQADANMPTTVYYSFNGTNSWNYIAMQTINGSNSSYRNTSQSYLNYILVPGTSANSTTSTFANTEFYIPNYTNSSAKTPLYTGVTPSNVSGYYTIQAIAPAFSNTQAITSITLTAYPGQNLTSDTSIYLYGIKKA
jgi:hypothetical protein